ncbi:MAG TPA: response regulator [Rhizomicrobium sp.]|nr:response regulator [Rhizomicrobium sp.]
MGTRIETSSHLALPRYFGVWQDIAALGRGVAVRFADGFTPDSLRLDPETRRRVLLFLASHFLGPWIGFAVLGALYLIDPHPGIPLLVAAAATGLFWAYPFLLRATGRLNILALASVQNLAFIVLYVSYYYGGLSSPFLPWLVTVPMLAFFYLGDQPRLRNLALAGLAGDILLFYLVHAATGKFPQAVPLEALSAAGMISVFCAGLYVTMMAFNYGRIAASNTELGLEIQRHKQTEILLLEAKEAAESAGRVKAEFLATMGHELRTPLNAIIGFSQLMGQEAFGPLGHSNYQEYVKDIEDSGTHLLDIINDILDISKAGSETIELDERLQDCQAIIVSSCRMVRARLKKSSLTLDLQLPVELPRLRADNSVVKRMLLSLLTNAIKFTTPGGKITVEAAADHASGLAITIRDSGIGIAEADLSRVRGLFVQADGSLTRQHEGMGLGLPFVETMMRAHGGSLRLESKLGEGTAATLLFPAGRLAWPVRSGGDIGWADEGGDTVISRPLSGPRDIAAAPENPDIQRLLVVEDDEGLCELIRRMLERAGFITIGARNGRDALRHLDSQQIDLIITDMVMPDMDGVELMRTLRRDRPRLPIVTLSGVEDFREYRRISKNLGAQAALRKPVSRADLILTAKNVLAACL